MGEMLGFILINKEIILFGVDFARLAWFFFMQVGRWRKIPENPLMQKSRIFAKENSRIIKMKNGNSSSGIHLRKEIKRRFSSEDLRM